MPEKSSKFYKRAYDGVKSVLAYASGVALEGPRSISLCPESRLFGYVDSANVEYRPQEGPFETGSLVALGDMEDPLAF